ncbi:MAG TPA: 16S rRNA (cytosine(1402)-N(4))-methyltransferase RsmH [Flavitalea sp.]|nr:16S rRNA (cytosine(1402)-N(4))-methyltransferase RsmH [Flavitalea sp.]
MKKEDDKTGSPSAYHIPVLLNEVIDALAVKPDGVYVDCTFGGGGHSKALLKRLGDAGRLLVFDQDAEARANLPDDPRITFLQHNFRHLQRFLRLHQAPEVDGIMADLGVSSRQFDESERGFSIRYDADLDMRMDKRQDTTAATILNSYSETRLHKLFEQYGEVTNAKTLARTIVEARKTGPIKTIAGLREAVHHIVKGNPNKYFAQAFQALRIEVNDELGALKELLQQVPDALKPGGRVAIISFHSLEDRLVKNFFKHGHFEESADKDVFGAPVIAPPLKPITKKPVTPGPKELRDNPRSRSAKMRAAEKKT